LYRSSSSSGIEGKDGVEEGDRNGGRLPRGGVPPPDLPKADGEGGPCRYIGVAGVAGCDRGREIRPASCWILFFAATSTSSSLRVLSSLLAA
jgi:hypothetical protein